jgi:hypothetical protein
VFRRESIEEALRGVVSLGDAWTILKSGLDGNDPSAQALYQQIREELEGELTAESSPVLAVIERAEKDGYRLTMACGAGAAGMTLRTGFGRSVSAPIHPSLDECARELLANWPEGKS